MKHLGLAFSTKNRVGLSRQSIEPLLRATESKQYNATIYWIDGSQNEEAENLPFQYGDAIKEIHSNIRGGADAAIVYALTELLRHPIKYDYIGLVENDVLLDDDWLEPTMALFERGTADGLEVGAVSARAYEDRVLIQCSDYAIMHNLGAGQVIFTRQAAELILQNYRTGYTIENRRVFHQLSGIEIGAYWAFRFAEHPLTADWTFDRILAQHGLASLALTPCKAQMIGQDPPMERQGLKLVTEVPWADDPSSQMRLRQYAERTCAIRTGELSLHDGTPFQQVNGSTLVFAHQLPMIDGGFEGEWGLKWNQGSGPFTWVAQGDGAVCLPGQAPINVERGYEFIGTQFRDRPGFKPKVRFDYDSLPGVKI